VSCSDSVTASPLRSTASTESFRRGSAAGTPQAGRPATRGQRRRAGPRCRAGGLAGAGSSIENGSPRRVVARAAATVPDRRCFPVLGAGQLRSCRHRSRRLHATAVRSHVPIAELLTGMPQVKVAACARPSRKTRLVRVPAGVPYPGHRTDACRLLPQRQVERSSQDPVFADARDRQQSDRDRAPSAAAALRTPSRGRRTEPRDRCGGR
jgi:hypothetical protein